MLNSFSFFLITYLKQYTISLNNILRYLLLRLSYHRSYRHNLSSCEIKAWKKKPALKGIPTHDHLQYQGSALPTKLSSHLWADYIVSS